MANNTTSLIGPSSGNHSGEAIFYGWKHSGRDRGSIDILWACLLTISLCCWVSTHPNVPSIHDKPYHRFVDKFCLACIGLIGPDFLLGIAMGQYASAKRSVELFFGRPDILKGREWTLTHGFFADMGGFLLTSPDYPEGFPVTGDQLFYLVRHDHVDFPNLTKKDIKDMSHLDTLSKIIVIWQVFWFVVTEVQRLRDGLPMTTLELTALSFSVMMIATSFFWYHKPSISRALTLSTKGNITVDEIRNRARNTTHPDLPQQWFRTPLYFLSGPQYWVDVMWQWFRQLTFIAHFPVVGRPMRRGLWDRIPNDIWEPYRYVWIYFVGGGLLLVFSASFVGGWAFYFPSAPERTLWRFATVYHCAFSIFGGLYIFYSEMDFKKTGGRWRRLETEPTAQEVPVPGENSHDVESPRPAHSRAEPASRRGPGRPRTSWWRTEKIAYFLNSWRNISPEADPELEISFKSVGPIAVLTVIYLTSRVFIYIEDFVSMRAQPQGVYVTVNRFLPVL